MPKPGGPPLESELLQGTLDLLILRTLVTGAAHGHTIAHAIARGSDNLLQVEHGSLYPALHRLEDRGWIASYWGLSENNRRARFYKLTRKGRVAAQAELDSWLRLSKAVTHVLRAIEQEG